MPQDYKTTIQLSNKNVFLICHKSVLSRNVIKMSTCRRTENVDNFDTVKVDHDSTTTSHIHTHINTFLSEFEVMPLSCLSNSFDFSRYTTFDPVIIIFSFTMSKPSQRTLMSDMANSGNKTQVHWLKEQYSNHQSQPLFHRTQHRD